MYKKNLTERVVVRLKPSELAYIFKLAEIRKCSVSEVIRNIIDGYMLERGD